MSLAGKLNVKPGMKIRVVGKPAGVDLTGIATTSSENAAGIVVFVKTLDDLTARGGLLVGAAKADRLTWVAYPKAGQLGTDLNRDVIWKHLLAQGVQGVRQVAIDDVWSAMRFRPGR
jgi:hypothetical protein